MTEVGNETTAAEKAFSFNTYQKKINLLVEVQTNKPFYKGKKDQWEVVSAALKQNFHYDCNSRQCKEHFESIMRQFRKDDLLEKRGSGTDEDFGEFKKLCQDLKENIDSEKQTNENQVIEKDAVEDLQNAALQRMKCNADSPIFTPSKRQNTKAGFQREYIEYKQELAEKKVRLEERKLELAEKELNCKIEESKRKHEAEMKDREHEKEMEKLQLEEEIKQKEHQRKLEEKRDEQFNTIIQLLQQQHKQN